MMKSVFATQTSRPSLWHARSRRPNTTGERSIESNRWCQLFKRSTKMQKMEVPQIL